MTDVLPGFDPPPPPVDAPKAERIPQKERDRLSIEGGIHPATRLPLAGNGKTCGDCALLRPKSAGNGSWWKCGTPDPRSKNHRGDGRDMTKRWPACIAFTPKDEGTMPEPSTPTYLCPECAQGKCRNCIGETLNDNDEWVPCGCPNHGGPL